MGLSGLSGTKWGSGLGLDGTIRECGGLSGTEDLCLLIRVSPVRDRHGLPKRKFKAKVVGIGFIEADFLFGLKILST